MQFSRRKMKQRNEMKWNGVEKKGAQNLQVDRFEVVCFDAADQMLVERASYANEGYYFFFSPKRCLNLYERIKINKEEWEGDSLNGLRDAHAQRMQCTAIVKIKFLLSLLFGFLLYFSASFKLKSIILISGGCILDGPLPLFFLVVCGFSL